MPRHIIAKHFGYKAKAKQIRRNQYVKVSGQEWWLESPDLLRKLEPGSYNLDVYYIPDQKGEFEEVYLWQGEKYIGRGVSYDGLTWLAWSVRRRTLPQWRHRSSG